MSDKHFENFQKLKKLMDQEDLFQRLTAEQKEMISMLSLSLCSQNTEEDMIPGQVLSPIFTYNDVDMISLPPLSPGLINNDVDMISLPPLSPGLINNDLDVISEPSSSPGLMNNDVYMISELPRNALENKLSNVKTSNSPILGMVQNQATQNAVSSSANVFDLDPVEDMEVDWEGEELIQINLFE